MIVSLLEIIRNNMFAAVTFATVSLTLVLLSANLGCPVQEHAPHSLCKYQLRNSSVCNWQLAVSPSILALQNNN